MGERGWVFLCELMFLLAPFIVFFFLYPRIKLKKASLAKTLFLHWLCTGITVFTLAVLYLSPFLGGSIRDSLAIIYCCFTLFLGPLSGYAVSLVGWSGMYYSVLWSVFAIIMLGIFLTVAFSFEDRIPPSILGVGCSFMLLIWYGLGVAHLGCYIE